MAKKKTTKGKAAPSKKKAAKKVVKKTKAASKPGSSRRAKSAGAAGKKITTPVSAPIETPRTMTPEETEAAAQAFARPTAISPDQGAEEEHVDTSQHS